VNEIIRHLVGLVKALFKLTPDFEKRFREKLDKT